MIDTAYGELEPSILEIYHARVLADYFTRRHGRRFTVAQVLREARGRRLFLAYKDAVKQTEREAFGNDLGGEG